MTMPLNLVLVRHGESEGNVANKLSRLGDNSSFTEEFLAAHSVSWGLTERGKQQALIAGTWIKENLGITFDKFYVSEYVRAMQTARILDLPDALWYTYYLLHERDWGELDVMTQEEKERLYPLSLLRRKQNPFYATPPNGESMTQLCLRTKDVLGTLHRECSDKNVIIVCHGEVMWSFRVNLERMTTPSFKELDQSKDPHDRIHNCQIIQYTRVDPISGVETSHLDWMRSVCPWDMTLSSNNWQRVIRPKFTNEELEEEIEKMLKAARVEVNS